MQVDSKVAHRRITRRGRQAEIDITPEYVAKIGDLYNQVFDQNKGGFETPIKVVNAEWSTTTIAAEFHEFAASVDIERTQRTPPSIW